MFGIGGGELIFIVLIILMLFGSDKIPDIARTMGKTMRQLKDATEDVKSEIRKGTESTGLNKTMSDIRGSIDKEIESAKKGIMAHEDDLQQTRQEIEDITSGPIKRQG